MFSRLFNGVTTLRCATLAAVVFASTFSVALSASAADACFPACRAGFVCSPDKKCVSECNPPCESTELCSAGACHPNPAMSGARAAPPVPKQDPQVVSTNTGASDAGTAEKTARAKLDAVPLPQLTFSILAGPAGVKLGKASAFGGELAFQIRYALGKDNGHGLVARLRGGGYDYSFSGAFGSVSYFMGSAALDLGYSGRYRFSGGNAGPLLLLSPQLVYANKTGYGLGVTVGGRVQVGDYFELQLPLTFGGLAASSSSGPSGFMFHASLLGGVTF
jgi:hypothetical protein